MIPRYGPTYTYSDLVKSYRLAGQADVAAQLCDRLSELYQVKHVFLLESARVGLYTILKAYDRPGEVIMPAYNCIVVPEAVDFAGYTPVFADIDYPSLSMNLDTLRAVVSPRTTALLATHLFGIPCQLDELVDYGHRQNMLVIEDAAPALGARFDGHITGNFGDAAILSFQSAKVIAAESGGALLTNRDDLAAKVKNVLEHAAMPGGNLRLMAQAFARKFITAPQIYPSTKMAYRLLKSEPMYEIVSPLRKEPAEFLRYCSNFSCALVLTQIEKLGSNLSRRRHLAEIYIHRLANNNGIKKVQYPAGSAPAWIQYPILTNEKSNLYQYMQHSQVDLSWTYRYSCAESYKSQKCPIAYKAANTVLGLPTYPSLKDEQAEYICQLVNSYGGEFESDERV